MAKTLRERRLERMPERINALRAQRDYVAKLRWRPAIYGLFVGILYQPDEELDAAVEAFRRRRLDHLDRIIATYEQALAAATETAA